MKSKLILCLAAGALLAATPARATTVDEFCDLDPHHWAYPAIKALVEKYHVMEGYPGGCPEVRQPVMPPAARPTPARKKPTGRKLSHATPATPAASPAPEVCAASPQPVAQ